MGAAQTERIAYIHTNHLGAAEALTDEKANPVWQARYAPFGDVIEDSLKAETGFAFHPRLPGQYADAESGLHYNRQRYYDPIQGRYLSPDPLGTPDGPNPYAYVAFNPFNAVDPDGLVLFAFDGTDNSNDDREIERLGGSRTNVDRLMSAYRDSATNYVSGVGTTHFEKGKTDRFGNAYKDIEPKGLGPIPDRGGNYTGRARIQRMYDYFSDELYASATGGKTEDVMYIDITGFSRGAAEARDFANRLVAKKSANTTNPNTGKKEYTDGLVRWPDASGTSQLYYRFLDDVEFKKTSTKKYYCQRIEFRFMGLFDTVLSVDSPLVPATSYQLGIPSEFSYVAQAVALNEHRSAPAGYSTPAYLVNMFVWDGTRRNLDQDLHQGGFMLESIGASSDVPGKVRIERGFIGAHADIGGGYKEGDNQLSFVALNWMAEQAVKAKVGIDIAKIDKIPTANPVIHDQSNGLRLGDPRTAKTVEWTEDIPQSNEASGPPMQVKRKTTITAEDREVRGGSGSTQRTMQFKGTPNAADNHSMTNADTYAYIGYFERPVTQNPKDTWNALDGNVTGTVDIKGYTDWLKSNGYFK